MPEQKLLVVNADDCALHPAVNQAVIEAHQKGILTSCSVLAGGFAFADAVNQLKKFPSLGVGVHLCVVEQHPVLPPSEIPSLVDKTGSFWRSHSTFVRRYLLRIVQLNEIRREFFAQVSKIIDSGLKITHMDCHQHLHVLPGIAEIVGDIGRKFDIRHVRIPRENIAIRATRSSWTRNLQMLMLNRLAGKTRNLPAMRGLTSSDYFFGFSCGGNLTEQVWAKLVPLLPSGSTEIMSHPGVNDATLEDATGWNYHWSSELRALCSPELKKSLSDHGVRLINYGDL